MKQRMRYLALASDYDDTLAHHGVVDAHTIESLESWIRSGRKFILVTGRELTDLQSIFPRFDLCERIVVENGAIVYNPATGEKHLLAQGPSEEFIQDLHAHGVRDLYRGEVMIGTSRRLEDQVLLAITEAGLQAEVIFNKTSLMILPAGVNKMTGLQAALEELQLSRQDVVGIGDAENDHALLECCGHAVAVANALDSLKTRAHYITKESRGAGVAEFIKKLLAEEL